MVVAAGARVSVAVVVSVSAAARVSVAVVVSARAFLVLDRRRGAELGDEGIHRLAAGVVAEEVLDLVVDVDERLGAAAFLVRLVDDVVASPFFISKAALSNSGTIMPRPNQPSEPPSRPDGQSEFFLASSAKSPPATMRSRMARIFSNAAALASGRSPSSDLTRMCWQRTCGATTYSDLWAS